MSMFTFPAIGGARKMPYETWAEWEARTGKKKEDNRQWRIEHGRDPYTLPDAGKTDPEDLWDYGGDEEEPVQTPYGPREREEGEHGPYGETGPDARAKWDPVLLPGQAICGTSILIGGVLSCLSVLYFISCL